MKILIIEDTKYMRTVLQDYLFDAGYKEVETAASAEEAFGLLGISQDKLDNLPIPVNIGCILMDIAMPGINGIEACKKIQSFECYKHVPIIMVTASKETDHLQKAFDAGAIDYIRKPVNKIELVVRVSTVLSLKEEMDERIEKEDNLTRLTDQLKESNVALEKLSFRDAVTGLSNSSHLERQLFTEWRRALRYRNSLSLILLELDNFDKFTKHNSKTRVKDYLREISSQIREKLHRPADLIARTGINQFAILLSDTSYDGTVTIAETMQKTVEQMNIDYKGVWKKETLTVSGGTITLIPSKKSSPSELVKRAKMALNKANGLGPNRIVAVDHKNIR